MNDLNQPGGTDDDLDALREFRGDLPSLGAAQQARARAQLAAHPASVRLTPPKRTPLMPALIGVTTTAVAAGVIGVTVMAWPTKESPEGIGPASGGTESSSSTSSVTSRPATPSSTSSPMKDPRMMEQRYGGTQQSLFGKGKPLHCLLTHDQPLGEVAPKLTQRLDPLGYKIIYRFPDPNTGDYTVFSQARAEADTKHKVSEVMFKPGKRMEVYFWEKENKQFWSNADHRAFTKQCPNPQ